MSLDQVESRSSGDPGARVTGIGRLGRLGVWVVGHGRVTAVVWALLIVGLGAFAPRVETELSGAGWQANGSESVAVRDAAERHFGGNASHAIQVIIRSNAPAVTEGAGARVIEAATRLLEADPRISAVIPVQPGSTL